jgi:hypothetical protein
VPFSDFKFQVEEIIRLGTWNLELETFPPVWVSKTAKKAENCREKRFFGFFFVFSGCFTMRIGGDLVL